MAEPRLSVRSVKARDLARRLARREQLTSRLTAACVVVAVALSHLPLARAEPQGGSASAAGDASATGDTSAANDEAAKAATTQPRGPRPSVDEICRTLAQAAADNELPEEFFTRLIGQESRFDPAAMLSRSQRKVFRSARLRGA